MLRHDLKDSDIPHRTKGRALIIEAWKERFKVLREEMAVCRPYYSGKLETHYHVELQKSAGQISFTSDLWTDKNMRSHLAVTAHWISESNQGDPSGTLRTALIAFHRISGRHTGQNLANVMMGVLDRAKITSRVIQKL